MQNCKKFLSVEYYLYLYFTSGFCWTREEQYFLYTYLCQHSPILVKEQKIDFTDFLFFYCFNGGSWPKIIQDFLAQRLYKLYEILCNDDFVDEHTSVITQNLTDTMRKILSKWKGSTISFTNLEGLIDITPQPAKRSITNCLTTLSKEGIVKKTKGKWAQIKIIKK